MAALIPRFLSNVAMLEKGLIPTDEHGHPYKELDLEGEEFEKLSDMDVKALAEALQKNSVFRGEIDLSENNLSDLATLYLSSALGSRDLAKSLDLSNNKLGEKSGVFIGDVLIQNPEYKIKKIKFESVNLGETGLLRIVEGINANQHIEKAHLGVVSDKGLEIVARLRARADPQQTLKIDFQEDPQARWSAEGMRQFSAWLKGCDSLTKVKPEPVDKEACEHFKDELKFHCKRHKKEIKRLEKIDKRDKKLSKEELVKQILEDVESGKRKNMPVKKHYYNTFGRLLNDALYQLQKRQGKNPDDEALFTCNGQVKFVAEFLQENLPHHEKHPEEWDQGVDDEGAGTVNPGGDAGHH